jgi:ABC-type uncharacterized transport system auxiliary subunit
MKKWLKIVLLILFIGACSMPKTRIYHLYIPVEKETTSHTKIKAPIAILIHSPRYLTQPYIVYRKSPYQIEISRYSKWEISPDEKMREVFKEAISSMGTFKEVKVAHAIPNGFYSLKIHLKQFERSDAGSDFFGELVFDVSFFSPNGTELYQNTISKSPRLEDRTPLSLAKGLSSVLTEGVEEVRSSIERSLSTGSR